MTGGLPTVCRWKCNTGVCPVGNVALRQTPHSISADELLRATPLAIRWCRVTKANVIVDAVKLWGAGTKDNERICGLGNNRTIQRISDRSLKCIDKLDTRLR